MAYKNEDTKLACGPRAFRTAATYLERSQYEPQTKKAFEIGTGGHNSQTATPEEDGCADNFSRGQFDQEEGCEGLHD